MNAKLNQQLELPDGAIIPKGAEIFIFYPPVIDKRGKYNEVRNFESDIRGFLWQIKGGGATFIVLESSLLYTVCE
jgi:hypothetical protein